MIVRGLIFALFTTQAYAWEASIDGPLCVLTHTDAALHIHLTYDPGPPQYAITLTRPETPWPDAAIFALRFNGSRPNLITTDRHSTNGLSLTVTDRGFGNVLDGFAFNETASVLVGNTGLTVSLSGASTAVAAFRACTVSPSA